MTKKQQDDSKFKALRVSEEHTYVPETNRAKPRLAFIVNRCLKRDDEDSTPYYSLMYIRKNLHEQLELRGPLSHIITRCKWFVAQNKALNSDFVHVRYTSGDYTQLPIGWFIRGISRELETNDARKIAIAPVH